MFGKRKSTIGVPRPKKTKVEAVEHLGAGTTSTSTGLTEQEEASASNQIEEDGGTLEDCEEESDKEARQQANQFVKNARADVRAMKIAVQKAEAALRHEKRRAEKSVTSAGGLPSSGTSRRQHICRLQLERAYKGKVKICFRRA